jgi:glycosyltransferase involved in cell wall biosynthesis
MKLNIVDVKPLVESVAIITPTIGKDTLRQCVESVQAQTYKNIKHLIVVDGHEHLNACEEALGELQEDEHGPIKINFLQENVGKGWYGHRAYAAFSFLFNADAVCFLDEDNWLDPNHVESLVATINDKSADWAFSFRKIYDKDGNYLCHDNCESLGIHPVYFDGTRHHLDTSSYLIRKEVAVRVASAWYGQWGADRQYFAVLAQHFPEVAHSKQHSLCYRLDGNEGSVTKEFFYRGNEAMKQRYGDNLPWLA